MSRFPSWVFPNVAQEEVSAIEIRFGYHVSRRDTRARLTSEEVVSLGLSRVESAAAALEAASPTTQSGWHIRAQHFQEDTRSFAGPSAQLAALCALVSARGGEKITSRLPIETFGAVWATGALETPQGGRLPELRPVGGRPGTHAAMSLQRKMQTFLDSTGRLFLCAHEDLRSCASLLTDSTVERWDLQTFREVIRGTGGLSLGLSSSRAVVGIGPKELKPLLGILFQGLFPRRRVTATALVARVGSMECSPLGKSFTENDSNAMAHPPECFHYERQEPHRVCLFASPHEALSVALGWVDRSRNGECVAVAIHSGAVDWDGFEASGDAIEVAHELAKSAAFGSVQASLATTHELSRERPVRGYRLGYQELPVLKKRVETYLITTDPLCTVLAPGPWHEDNWSRTAAAVAIIFTCVRIPCGLVAASALYCGAFTLAFALYGIGLMTDIADGFVAREWNGTTAWGKKWDGRIDMIFNFVTALGYGSGAIWRWGSMGSAIAPFATCGLVMLGSLPWCQPHSAAAKIRSGVVRMILLTYIMVKLRWMSVDITILIALSLLSVFGVTHELKVIRDEIRNGERGKYTTPRHRAPYAYHRITYKLIRPFVPKRLWPQWLDEK
jgi:phosphatidylglycerophosphate synthase